MNHDMRMCFAAALLAALPALAGAAEADAEKNAQVNAMLEANASSAAFARMCDDEPTSEQLKSSTMMLLVVAGYPAHTVQMGSAKFNDVMRREIAAVQSLKDVDCETRTSEARARLAGTQQIIQGSRRDAPPPQ